MNKRKKPPPTAVPGDWTPLYDQEALDAAVAEANRRQNAAWALMAEKLVAAERERCAKACRSAVYGRLGSATMRQVAEWCAEEIESGRKPLPGA